MGGEARAFGFGVRAFGLLASGFVRVFGVGPSGSAFFACWRLEVGLICSGFWLHFRAAGVLAATNPMNCSGSGCAVPWEAVPIRGFRLELAPGTRTIVRVSGLSSQARRAAALAR